MFSRLPVSSDSEQNNHAVVIKRQCNVNIYTDTPENVIFEPTGSTVVVQCEDGGLWTHGIGMGH